MAIKRIPFNGEKKFHGLRFSCKKIKFQDVKHNELHGSLPCQRPANISCDVDGGIDGVSCIYAWIQTYFKSLQTF